MNIKLLNDHGDVIDLNGNNWSFTLVFEYLYNLKGIWVSLFYIFNL